VAEQESYWTDEPEIPFQGFMVGLYEDDDGGNPPRNPAKLSADYAETIGVAQEFPVFSDVDGTMEEIVPFSGARPFNCAVSPDMVILECWDGAAMRKGYKAIEADWEARGG
jgi:hypothetical protein